MTQSAPYIDPARPRSRIKPFKAWGHMQKLLADKEDTSQVFHIIEALNGDAIVNDFKQFSASQNGREIMSKRQDLPTLLDDHAPLKRLPVGTVGHAYVTFMEREGLSAAGLVAESRTQRQGQKDYADDLEWYGNRLRDTHDLYHIMSGYGRDALGEDALLAYTHSQHGGLGVNFIVFMGSRQIAKLAPPDIRVKDVVAEARRNGKAAKRVVDQDIEALLREPIEAARERLGIQKPIMYDRAMRILKEHDIEPALLAA